MLETSLILDNDLLENGFACSISSSWIDPSLFKYNILFEDDEFTPKEPSGENDVEGIACLESYSLYANPLWCKNIPPKDGNLFLGDESTLKGRECEVLERNDQLGDDNFDLLEFLRNPISDFSLKIDCGCDPLYDTPPMFDDYKDELLACKDLSNNSLDFSGGMCLLEGTSIEREGVHYLEITSSTMCDLIVESTHGDDVETGSEYSHEDTLVELDLSDTILHSLFAFDDMYAIVESISCSLGEAYGEREYCLDPCLWLLFLFDPGAKYRNGDVGAPNLLLGLHDKQSVILENPRAKVSLFPWGNVSKCASLLDTIVFKLQESQLVDAKFSICLKERMWMCLNALSSPLYAFTLDSFLYYLFAYDDIHASFGFVLCRGRKFVGLSTCMNDNAIWILWTLEPIEAPPLVWSLEEIKKQLCLMAPKMKVVLPCGLFDAIRTFVVSLSLGDLNSQILCAYFNKFLIFNSKDPWLYCKYKQPWHVEMIYCANPNPHAMRSLYLFVLSLVLQGLDSRSNPFQEGEDDTRQMAIITFDAIIRGQHMENLILDTLKAREYAWGSHEVILDT